MEELLNQIKKMSRAEQMELIDQIYALESEPIVEDQTWLDELERRAARAVQNSQSGTSWDIVKARLLSRNNEHQEGK